MELLTWQALTTLIVIGCVFSAMILTRIPADFALLAGLGILSVSGILSPSEALSGFSSEGMITIGLLYVIVSGLQETGVLTWISHHVLGRPKTWRRAQVRSILPVVGTGTLMSRRTVFDPDAYGIAAPTPSSCDRNHRRFLLRQPGKRPPFDRCSDLVGGLQCRAVTK